MNPRHRPFAPGHPFISASSVSSAASCSILYPTPYPAGTLVIDLVDSKTWEILKRNNVCRPVMRQLPTEERVARLQEAVDEALKGLRVAK